MLDGNITLAEARQAMLESEQIDPLLGLIKITRSIRVRFVEVPSEQEFGDGMKLWKFRELCGLGLAKLVVDDEGGGLKAKAPEPELV